MQIRRFFEPSFVPGEGTVTLSEAESQHALRVLRLEPGDRLQLLNGRGGEAQCRLLAAEDGGRRPKNARVEVLSAKEAARPAFAVTLCVAVPRGKNFDAVLRMAVELGVAQIQPLLCRYSVARPQADSLPGWEAVAVGALKQSGNLWLPQILPPRPFMEVRQERCGQPGYFGAVPREGEPSAVSAAAAALGGSSGGVLWIGPEGGFAPEEEDELRQDGVLPLTVGSWVMRVETAVPVMLGFLLALREAAGLERPEEK